MLSNKDITALQKTYDHSYLSCSTAVYYEGQGDEGEATKYWKAALRRINEYYASSSAPRVSESYTGSDTVLIDALKELELQCKERIDLLEALKLSREDSFASTCYNDASSTGEASGSTSQATGTIGDGTIPAVTYSELSRPVFPSRASLDAMTSPEEMVRRIHSTPAESTRSHLDGRPLDLPDTRGDRSSRAPSPEKRTLRTTLRSRKQSDQSPSARRSSKPVVDGSSLAATIAWGSSGSPGARDNLLRPYPIEGRSKSSPSPRHSPRPSPRPSLERNPPSSQKSVLSYDVKTPRTSPKKWSVVPPYDESRLPQPSGLSISAASSALTSSAYQDPSVSYQSPSKSEQYMTPRKPPVSDEMSIQSKKGSVKASTSSNTGTSGRQRDPSIARERPTDKTFGSKTKAEILKNLPPGIDEGAAKQILNDIVVQGDEVHWDDIAGLEVAKNSLRETVVYPFLRPDLFMGLREPARGMLLFGPPGTGKTMLARAVATESKSTFFSISASSLTSKYLGESEKLVRALFGLAKALAPSIIFVDEIDSLLSQRSGSGEHESTRRIKTEFLIQWSELQQAAAGRETTGKGNKRSDAQRVLVLAATNLPWAIDEAARRRFVRRQYIPLPEPQTRETQLRTLLRQQNHSLSDLEIEKLVQQTDGFSGSDITSLAKDAAMGPLRSLGEALLYMAKEEIRPIDVSDFELSLKSIRPSVDKKGIREYEEWAEKFGERGG
ncbi:P-loop containing nucleoside triphosphate hydrolase protein [Trichoderma evansii]